ncbi:DUF4488 domain-containing protein [Snuella sedimenti]|uniref:DUF4488 domain-containing protein n=1 Tax=Snuella sedimenti TaxID=2798802 RepID=A0A8J7J971_9FLAO|nr:DUF4488 domain-containing protein [Snuella sedimenti]MBJ6366664.1 DUF4488 domain-containing protein [Snuella sedimenti]
MKNILVLIFSILSLYAVAQAEQTHVPASKSLAGIWRQTGIKHPVSGKVVDVLSGNYKVINPDGTFYTVVTWNSKDPLKGTTIGQYGDYKITSDSTLVEHIVQHVMNPNLNGKEVKLKYRLIDTNTVMIAWRNIDRGIWIDERWTRLPLSR